MRGAEADTGAFPKSLLGLREGRFDFLRENLAKNKKTRRVQKKEMKSDGYLRDCGAPEWTSTNEAEIDYHSQQVAPSQRA